MFLKKNDKKSENSIKGKGIYVLGSGCRTCNKLEENLKLALEELGINEEVLHITDFRVIASFGVMSTPALVVDNEVISHGKLLSKQDCVDILKKVRK